MSQPSQPFLLVASPQLRDPHFERVVVLVTRHDDDGAFGWILNRPLGQRLGDVVGTGLDDRVGDVPLYRGGPVEPAAAQFLTDASGDAVRDLPLPGVAMLPIEDAEGPHDLGELVARLPDDAVVRGYLGYAGWGSGQLDAEIDEGSWLLAPAEARHVFGVDAERLWRTVLWDLGGEARWIALDDVDPSLN